MTCSYKRTIARLLIGVLVYAQLAVAAYACNSGTPDHAAMAMASVTGQVEALAYTQQLDADQPTLCVAHCRSDPQNADAKPWPVPPIALMAGYFTLEPVTCGGEHDTRVLTAGAPPPLADPPHAVLHCCLRI